MMRNARNSSDSHSIHFWSLFLVLFTIFLKKYIFWFLKIFWRFFWFFPKFYSDVKGILARSFKMRTFKKRSNLNLFRILLWCLYQQSDRKWTVSSHTGRWFTSNRMAKVNYHLNESARSKRIKVNGLKYFALGPPILINNDSIIDIFLYFCLEITKFSIGLLSLSSILCRNTPFLSIS